MIIFRKANALREYLDKQRKNGRTIGFIPTMGALHEGHISLIRQAQSVSGFTVTSIFVNPTQFNDPSDFAHYPITLEADIRLLLNVSTDALFLPDVREIYESGIGTLPQFELGPVEKILEGEFRPGHFQGVAQVMDRLLSIIGMCSLFMGRKDYQQCMVVQKLIDITSRNAIVSLVVCPTLRETDGLAMSSRNRRLSPVERIIAPAIYKSLQYIKDNVRFQPAAELKAKVFVDLQQQGFRPDYVSIADAYTLEEIEEYAGTNTVALVAAFLGPVRLIDNLVLNVAAP